jgi:hypothetical protein
MKNINYDLLKLLHSTLDDIWRLEKYYIKDAKKVKCHSRPALEKMLETKQKDAQMLLKEIEMRMKAKIFN